MKDLTRRRRSQSVSRSQTQVRIDGADALESRVVMSATSLIPYGMVAPVPADVVGVRNDPVASDPMERSWLQEPVRLLNLNADAHGIVLSLAPGVTTLSEETLAVVGQLGGTLSPGWTPSMRWLGLPDAVDLEQARQQLIGQADLAAVEPNGPMGSLALTPNDPSYSSQYGLNTANDADIDAPAAWDISLGKANVVVAVTDTGIRFNHPDLYNRVLLNQAEIPTALAATIPDTNNDGLKDLIDINAVPALRTLYDANSDGKVIATELLSNPAWADGIDQDGDSLVDDLFGWDFYNNDNNASDDHGHGTHVSGTIAAATNNATGVSGVNWRSRIMPIKNHNSSGNSTLISLLNSLNYTALKNADVVNASWVLTTFLTSLQTAVGKNPGLIAAAAGNANINNDTTPYYPAAFTLPNVLSVAASDENGNRAAFSNYGAVSVDLAAPGNNILSTTLFADYGNMSGTSMAAPHAAGVASLVKGLAPTWTASQIRQHLINTAKPKAAFTGITVSGGIISAGNALTPLNVAPFANFDSRTPGATDAPLDSVVVRFSEPVSGIDVDDFKLTRNGGTTNLLINSETIVYADDDGETWTLAGLSQLTDVNSVYTITLNANSGIVDGTNLPLAADIQTSITVQAATPAVTDIRVLWGASGSASLLDAGVLARNTLPWDNVRSIEYVFNGAVILDPNGLKVTGLSGTNALTYQGFNDQSFTARWDLTTPIGSAAWYAARPTGSDILGFNLDGDDASGDSTLGAHFGNAFLAGGDNIRSNLKFLPGDFDDNGFVTSSDAIKIRNIIGQSNLFADIDGNGIIDANDMTLARKRIGNKL